MKNKENNILDLATQLRWEIGEDFHDQLAEGIYADATNIARKVVIKEGEKGHFNFDRALDNVLTSRIWGFPIMIAILGIVLWLTIIGANYPSGLLADLLLGNLYPFL